MGDSTHAFLLASLLRLQENPVNASVLAEINGFYQTQMLVALCLWRVSAPRFRPCYGPIVAHIFSSRSNLSVYLVFKDVMKLERLNEDIFAYRIYRDEPPMMSSAGQLAG